ncbi:DNA-3-methyladenine glycosylase I [Bathymodiolus platifrons methanotrophic gill symbiont]|uniref:DNA-3-methyladenine glycosylase I n=1 Tax=Bathymodiolus platifrons methanotrophic gill symbiont TaxID=113268 RepID=UPI000B40E458|nr:DNA-3-methyladenine glycosylase I [Bathymodiolus platifrons methanotrophic gill symbiont]TXK96866.1 DNA-3-methyladenine glycosylase I [Methylococcaceae bacterium CS4]TXK98705.1 DNA-3-methyladenine glycosylase I [Methylococcaceae bacterium CS5]TXL05146.1 DNA-3-methyladenine glycosylase I [Methylococcaceae bacterium CS1]TXL07360.1 DNA-3-methyladenine glycosylase I [Methylococcaceae bacterium CS3]TXL09903.1 DNA-3-methyladenine glycosylase I [Methylococcaceae bacterium CS2]TXL13808.1 DNA-3-met
MRVCPWALGSDLEEFYHDTEWGVPVHDDRLLFEFLILEGAQAGLSWSTVLKKRAGYRKAFDNFDIYKVASYSEQKQLELQNNPDIIRNKLKISSAVTNAQAFIAIQEQYGNFDAYIWSFVNGQTIKNTWQTMQEVPANTPESDVMSKSLKKAGFKFVGTTICYAYMQAVGMVNDHLVNCPRYNDVNH